MSNTYYLNHYLFLNKHLLFLFKALVQDQYITTTKIWREIDFFLSKLGKLRPSDLQCFKLDSNYMQTNYYTVSYAQIIFSKITFLEYSNISMTNRTHPKVGVCQDTLIYSNCFNSRQNGKHRRSRPREGRVGDVWPPGSKLPGTVKQSTWQQCTTKYNQGKDKQVQLGTTKYKMFSTTKYRTIKYSQ